MTNNFVLREELRTKVIGFKGYGASHTNDESGAYYDSLTLGELEAAVNSPTRVEKLCAGWFVPLRYMGSDARSIKAQKEHGIAVLALVLDFDQVTTHGISYIVERTRNVVCGEQDALVVAFSTRSATKSNKRVRVVIPFDAPVSVEHWLTYLHTVMEELKSRAVCPDSCLRNIVQISFLPNEGEFYEREVSGASLFKLDENDKLMQKAKILYDKLSAEEENKQFERGAMARNQLVAFSETINDRPADVAKLTCDHNWEGILKSLGYYEVRENVWTHPDSTSGHPSGKLVSSSTGPHRVFTTFNSTYNSTWMSPGSGGGYVADIAQAMCEWAYINGEVKARGDDRAGTKFLAANLQAIDPQTRDTLGITIDEYNARKAGMMWTVITLDEFGEKQVWFVAAIGEDKPQGQVVLMGVDLDAFMSNKTKYEQQHAERLLSKALSGDPSVEFFEVTAAKGDEMTEEQSYFIDPWVPTNSVVGVYGRGESGKSTFVSTLVAQISQQSVGTLWVSSEEAENNIKVRYNKSGGKQNALLVMSHMPKEIDTGKVVAFDVYEHLDKAIIQAISMSRRNDVELRCVVLDAVVSLVTFGKGESPNDDSAVKRLIAFLSTLCQRYKLTIFMLGHVNKNSTGKYREDMVTGSAAWTNSPRVAYMINKDRDSESDYESVVELVKANLGTRFSARIETAPVHTIHKRENGADQVLCRTNFISDISWGNEEIERLVHCNSDDPEVKKSVNKREKNRQEKVKAGLDAVLQGNCTTRAEIIEYAKRNNVTLYDKYFSAYIDQRLSKEHKIKIEVGARGVHIYSKN
nr:AAA family ATPase [uncultured Cohaesibacter sp.]